EVYEIADYGPFERFPYFRVFAGGTWYGSEAMGRGELCLLLTYWTLRDVRKDSILVLEEPETHVSPQSQKQLMNVIAKFCDEKGIWVVIATHSPTIVSRIPEENLVMLISEQESARQISLASKLQLSILLGGGVAFIGALITEDNAAKDFLIVLLQELDPDLYAQFEVISAKGAGNITLVLNSMPRTG